MQGRLSKTVTKMVTATLVSAALTTSIMANAAPVYKITKGEDTVYIGGTIHLLTDVDYPLQPEFEKAYVASSEVYFETDIGMMEDPSFAMKALPYITYQDGSNLKAGLKPETFKRLDEYMTSKGLPTQQFLALNPTGVMLTLTMMEYQSQGFTAEGVDAFFFKKSTADNKKIAWFESPEEQLKIIGSFGNEDPDGMINYTLDELAKGSEAIDALHDSWRSGDMEKLSEIGLNSFDDYKGLYNSLVKSRNDAWMVSIETMFGDEGTELILVGALHLPGVDGVLTQLEEKGYLVEKL